MRTSLRIVLISFVAVVCGQAQWVNYPTAGVPKKPDGSPNVDAIYGTDFYDDMVAGVKRIMNMGAIIGSPVIVGNVIYVGSADGNLYALM